MLFVRKVLHLVRTIDGLNAMLRGATTSAFLHICASGLGFFVRVFMARFMGADAYGLYTFLFTWAAVLGLPACLGLDIALLKLTPIYSDNNQGASLIGLRRRALQIGLVFGGFIGCAFFVISTLAIAAGLTHDGGGA